MKLIGHRGVCGLEPENTLRSIKRAIELGLTTIEIDVYRIEGELIVIHDDTVDRTTNGSGCIYDLGLDKIRSLDAGKGEKVPFLFEVLEILSSDCLLNIEIKGANVANALIEQVKDSKVIISSFDWAQLITCRSLVPDIPLAVLTEQRSPWEIASKVKAHAINPSIEMVNSSFVKQAHSSGYEVWAYTIRSIEQWHKALSNKVDACFVDDPLHFLQTKP